MDKKVSKKITTSLLKSLGIATVEKDVENAYRATFEKVFPGCISSPGGSDGVLRASTITSLLEFKYDLDLRNPLERSSVIVQSLFYLKKMMNRGESLVKVAFVGDVNECFCIPTKDLTKYFSYDIDWSTAPSSAAEKNPALVVEIAADENIQPFVYDIDEKFDFQAVLEKMENVSLGKPYAITITKNNIVEIFRRFEKDVIIGVKYGKGQVWTGKEEDKMRGVADLFFTCITSPNDVCPHREKKNVLKVRGMEAKANILSYYAFISQFSLEHTPSELEELTACKDTILEDAYRRCTGAFFTPQIWVGEAHKMIAEQFGDNWKDEYVVWDCAAGTVNLTKGKSFKELYISTLDQSDIDTVNDCRYNRGAIIFQYDFLSELGIDKVPSILKKAFENGKKILFFINPPFGKSTGVGCPKGAGKSVINEIMLKNKMGLAAAQQFAQFMYKIKYFTELYPQAQVSVALFSRTLFMTGTSFRKFRSMWEDCFQFLTGMIFNAGNFTGVSANWGISFTIWKSKSVGDVNHKKILFLKKVGNDYKIKTDSNTKELYHADGVVLTGWAKEKDSRFLIGGRRILGCFNRGGNSVGENNRTVQLYSGEHKICLYEDERVVKTQAAVYVVPENFERVVASFAAKKLVKSTWHTDIDEYMIPNTEHPDYRQWVIDALPICLFDTSSRQSSFRDIYRRGKSDDALVRWSEDIKNEFFFMSNKEMRKLSGDNIFKKMNQDTYTYPKDRYVYNLLQTTLLSDDAKELVERATQLIRKSMKKRKEYYENGANSNYHLNAWDAGWAQFKPMLKKYYKEDYDAFVQVYKKFEDRMREGVYKFGFLKC